MARDIWSPIYLFKKSRVDLTLCSVKSFGEKARIKLQSGLITVITEGCGYMPSMIMITVTVTVTITIIMKISFVLFNIVNYQIVLFSYSQNLFRCPHMYAIIKICGFYKLG